VLGDDLQQHLAGQVLAGLGVAHLEGLAIHDQLAHVFDGDVTRDLGVVQAAVRVLLDDARFAHSRPGMEKATRRYRNQPAAPRTLRT